MAELNCENDKNKCEMRVSEGKNSKGRFVSSGKFKENLDKVAVMQKGKILNERKRKLAVCNDENERASDDDTSKTTLKRPKRQQQTTSRLVGSRVVDIDTLKKGLSKCLACGKGMNLQAINKSYIIKIQ
ncbi:Hypothetical predicted protein [Paramuricea clavata]|uniref:Uncharacterized protein n=1 Tax=Paramuricea clavata TaxID=317549 RepID=A0A7D9E3X0_PARCT|nr:Hypothetical predicted protein [Paramuricea clavata]